MRLYLVTAFVVGLFSLSSALKDQTFVLEPPDGTDKKMVVITRSEETDGSPLECVIFTDKQRIEEVLKKYKDVEIRKPSVEEMKQLLDECTTFSLRRRRRRALSMKDMESIKEGNRQDAAETTTTEGYSGWNVIFPGTKWCGAGAIAKDYNDLGFHQDTDRCCRAHDLCDDLMAPGETKNNLTNDSKFTKLSCECDNDFYDCLSRINTITSNTIGNMYFNLLARSCYSKEYPKSNKCKKYRSFLKITCAEYKRDMKATPVYQWISAKIYKKIPIPGPLTITLPF